MALINNITLKLIALIGFDATGLVTLPSYDLISRDATDLFLVITFRTFVHCARLLKTAEFSVSTLACKSLEFVVVVRARRPKGRKE